MNYKKEKFQVAGVSHYSDDIMEKIAYENDDYSLSARELADIYDVGDRIFEYSFDDCNASLVPEPTNEHDPNAVRVEVNGILIGYIKRGSCSHVKNLLNSPDFDHVKVEIGGGKYKRLYEDEDKIKVEKDSCGLFADVYVFSHKAESEVKSVSSSPDVRPMPNPTPNKSQKKKKSGAVSTALIIFGVIAVFFGLGTFSSNISSGIFDLILGCVCLYFGIQKRRNAKKNL